MENNVEKVIQEKNVATVRKITGEMIGGFFLYGIIYGIIFGMFNSAVQEIIIKDNLMLKILVNLFFNGCAVYWVWRSSVEATFKTRKIRENDVNIVMKNLLIFTIIACVLYAMIQSRILNSELEQLINRDFSISFQERMVENYGTESEKEIFRVQKENAVKKIKQQVNVYYYGMQVGILIIYIGVLPGVKKRMSEHIA